jgi:hypothetical protein
VVVKHEFSRERGKEQDRVIGSSGDLVIGLGEFVIAVASMTLGVANREFVESNTNRILKAEFILKRLNLIEISQKIVGAQDNQICTGSSNPDHPDHPDSRRYNRNLALLLPTG